MLISILLSMPLNPQQMGLDTNVFNEYWNGDSSGTQVSDDL
jgi:hypothetical protein